MMRWLALLVLAFVVPSGAFAQGDGVTIRAENPRPFGYAVGDVLNQRITIEVNKPLALDRTKLPKNRRVSAWLELRDSSLTQWHGLETTRYRISLTYQLMNSPTQVQTLFLPAVPLKFRSAGEAAQHHIEEWPFTMAPITPETVLASHGLDEMRPSVSAPAIATQSIRLRLGLYAACLGALLLYLGYRGFGVPFLARHNGPFARAHRALRKPLTAGSDFSQAFRKLHQAFDETAAATVLPATLDKFLHDHPGYAIKAEQIRWFFEQSQRAFFATSEPERSYDHASLTKLCRELRDCERGLT